MRWLARTAIKNLFTDINNKKMTKKQDFAAHITWFNQKFKAVDEMVGILKKTKSRSFRALANEGGVCRHWAALLKRLIKKMFPGNNVVVDKPASESHTWVRIKLDDKVCTHVDSFWASGFENEQTGVWSKYDELNE